MTHRHTDTQTHTHDATETSYAIKKPPMPKLHAVSNRFRMMSSVL
jgi:hypothetical protein